MMSVRSRTREIVSFEITGERSLAWISPSPIARAEELSNARVLRVGSRLSRLDDSRVFTCESCSVKPSVPGGGERARRRPASPRARAAPKSLPRAGRLGDKVAARRRPWYDERRTPDCRRWPRPPHPPDACPHASLRTRSMPTRPPLPAPPPADAASRHRRAGRARPRSGGGRLASRRSHDPRPRLARRGGEATRERPRGSGAGSGPGGARLAAPRDRA